MIWSEVCIDEKEGFDIQIDGSAKPRKIGRYVLSIEECEKIMNEQR